MRHTISVKHLCSPISASIGLLGASKAYPVYCQTRFGIHTFGMKFPIDVLILDKNFEVVRLKSGLIPNRLFLWPIWFIHIVELPSGYISKHSIQLGEMIELHCIKGIPSEYQ